MWSHLKCFLKSRYIIGTDMLHAFDMSYIITNFFRQDRLLIRLCMTNRPNI